MSLYLTRHHILKKKYKEKLASSPPATSFSRLFLVMGILVFCVDRIRQVIGKFSGTLRNTHGILIYLAAFLNIGGELVEELFQYHHSYL